MRVAPAPPRPWLASHGLCLRGIAPLHGALSCRACRGGVGAHPARDGVRRGRAGGNVGCGANRVDAERRRRGRIGRVVGRGVTAHPFLDVLHERRLGRLVPRLFVQRLQVCALGEWDGVRVSPLASVLLRLPTRAAYRAKKRGNGSRRRRLQKFGPDGAEHGRGGVREDVVVAANDNVQEAARRGNDDDDDDGDDDGRKRVRGPTWNLVGHGARARYRSTVACGRQGAKLAAKHLVTDPRSPAVPKRYKASLVDSTSARQVRSIHAGDGVHGTRQALEMAQQRRVRALQRSLQLVREAAHHLQRAETETQVCGPSDCADRGLVRGREASPCWAQQARRRACAECPG